MKKFLLSLAAAAVAFGASADKALIICDGAQIFYPGELPEGTVVVPVGFTAKEITASVPCNAGELKWDKMNTVCQNGAMCSGANKITATFTPTPGITITKITVKGMPTKGDEGKWNLVFAKFVKDEANPSIQTYTPDGGTTAAVTMAHTGSKGRYCYYEIEYTGTPTQVLPAIAKNFDLAQNGEVEFASATEGATIHYTLDGTTPTAASPVAENGVVKCEGNVLIKTIAVKDGLTDSYIYELPVMNCKAGSQIAAFRFCQFSGIQYLKDGEPTDVSNSDFPQAGDNVSPFDPELNGRFIIGPCLTGDTSDRPIVPFVRDGVKIYFYGGNSANPQYFYSATYGGNYELRTYVNTTMNFEAPEGKVITDVMYNGSPSPWAAEFTLGYSQLEEVDGANKYVYYTENIPGTLFTSPIYTSYQQHYTAPEGGVKKVQILSTGTTTKYIDNVYVCYADVVGSSSVATIAADENAPVEYYNMQGVRVANPENGIFIRRQGTKTSKVVIK